LGKEDGTPVMLGRIEAAQQKRAGLRVCWMMLVGFDMMCAQALAAPPAQAAGSGSTSASAFAELPALAAHDGLGGADACAPCHAEVTKSFGASAHAKVAPMPGGSSNPCETCHGAGSAHIAAGGDTTKIINPAKASRKDFAATINLICTQCHTEMRGPFAYEHAPIQAEGCVACHSPHGSENAGLLKQPMNAVCTQCHSPSAGASVHSTKPGSQPKPCTDCHTHIHGSNRSATFLKAEFLN